MMTGDVCRAKCGAPARYVGFGVALYVSAMCNDLSADDAKPAKGGETRLPLPENDAVLAANSALHAYIAIQKREAAPAGMAREREDDQC